MPCDPISEGSKESTRSSVVRRKIIITSESDDEDDWFSLRPFRIEDYSDFAVPLSNEEIDFKLLGDNLIVPFILQY